MRGPTPRRELYAWHGAALAGLRPQVTHDPHCGWFKRRLVRGGPWIGARIWLEQRVEDGELVADETMRCEVNGEERDPHAQWTYLADHPISEKEFLYLASLNRWAAAHAPDHPAANPRGKIDFHAAPIPF